MTEEMGLKEKRRWMRILKELLSEQEEKEGEEEDRR